MSEAKDPTTFDQQIEILKKRGMIINDTAYAKDVLSKINYYRFTGYFYDLKSKGDNYLQGVTFEQKYRTYEFDARLRNVLLFVIEKVEVLLKTRISYYYSHEYGSLGYLDSNNFSSEYKHAEFIKLLNRRIDENKNRLFVRHHIREYEGKFPLWVASELFTFGMLGNFYHSLLTVDKKEIAKQFGITYNMLGEWLNHITYSRNLAAHYMRLYNFAFQNRPSVAIKGRIFSVATGKIFDAFYILSYLYLDKNEWENYIIRNLENLFRKYKGIISLDLIGFPKDWEEYLNHIK